MRSAFFSEGIRKPAGMILTENLLVDGFRSLCRSLIHVRRMECAKRKLTGFLCLIHIILHIWDRFGQSLGVAANSVFRSRRSLRAPLCGPPRLESECCHTILCGYRFRSSVPANQHESPCRLQRVAADTRIEDSAENVCYNELIYGYSC